MRIRLVAFFVMAAATLICLGGSPSRGETVLGRCEAVASAEVSHASTSDSLSGPNLKESIEPRYEKRYAQWKNEFLAAEIARVQWELYAKHPHLTLTITVSPNNKHGAGTGNYK
jgi:hypothetical protein